MLTFREITKTIFDLQINKTIEAIREEKGSEKKGSFTLLLLDKDKGAMFEQELQKLSEKFQAQKQILYDGIDINLDDYIFILLSSRIKDIVPSIDKKKIK